MKLLRLSSPHSISGNSTQAVMRWVCFALIPAILLLTLFYGWGTLLNCTLAISFGLLLEGSIAKLRGRTIAYYLNDYSAILSALLLALTVPPYSPWWILLIGMFFAIVIGKQLFGGLGNNPFNPAMVGYVVLLISFPAQLTIWPQALSLQQLPQLSIMDSIAIVLNLKEYSLYLPDGYSGATALDIIKHNNTLTLEQIYQQPLFANAKFATVGSEWVNIAFLSGGIVLLYKRILTWHAPVGMLLALSICAMFGYNDGGSDSHGSITFHLLNGATMLGAFFIITDPVSGATSNSGRFVFGVGVGLITYIIRIWGQYPDGLAFAVLLMNFSAPFIDYYTQPRSYGHNTKKTRNIMNVQ